MNHSRRPITSRLRVAFVALAASLLALALPAAASALPSDRAYEMVSPPEKNNQGVGSDGAAVDTYGAAVDGDAVAYTAMGGWGDSPAFSATGTFLGERGESAWSSTSLLLPLLPPFSTFAAMPLGISRDFGTEVVNTNRDPDGGAEISNGSSGWAYVVDTATKEYHLLTGENLSGRFYATNRGDFQGADDYSTIFFGTSARLTEESTTVEGSLSNNIVYRYADGERAAISENAAGTLVPAELPATGRPVSADGSTVFYSAIVPGNTGGIYRRVFGASDDAPAVLVNAAENPGESVPESSATFMGASRDGDVAYFASIQKLLPADTDTSIDLYHWDAAEPEGSRLTLISADDESADGDSGHVQTRNLVGYVAPDGGRIYFVHPSQLVAGGPTDTGNKLYAWDGEDGLRYIATDDELGASGSNFTVLAMSESGEHLGLLSAADLSGESSTGLDQAYLYDYGADRIRCGSCVAEGLGGAPVRWRPPNTATAFQEGSVQFRNVSDRGDVFFETDGALLPEDTNAKSDVYTWRDGRLDLLSSGRSGDHSHFADASADGKDAFFTTREQLSGWDVDNQVDLYDARVDGGLPEPTTPMPPCQGDDCQGDVSEGPGYEDPGSSTYEGDGNPAQQAKRVCLKAERKANRLERKAKRLQRKAHRAKGKRRAKRLNKRAQRVRKKARRASRRATRCNRGADS